MRENVICRSRVEFPFVYTFGACSCARCEFSTNYFDAINKKVDIIISCDIIARSNNTIINLRGNFRIYLIIVLVGTRD